MRETGGAPDDPPTAGVWARTLAWLAPAASRAADAAPTSRRGNGPGVVAWRVVLLGLSFIGTVAALACAFTGQVGLALRVLLATLLVLGALLAVAVR